MQDLFQNIEGSRDAPAARINEQLEGLTGLSIPELKKRWLQLYGSEPPKRLSRELLTRAIAHRLQEKALGGLKPATKRRLAAMVTEYECRGKVTLPSKPLYKPGTRLIRQWHGRNHNVTVLDKGFEYDGGHYRSLSAIAREITGARWSGPRFFGIDGKSTSDQREARSSGRRALPAPAEARASSMTTMEAAEQEKSAEQPGAKQ